MGLLMNALAYRQAYPDDQEAGWPEGAPVRLVDQVLQSSSPKARDRSLDKLWRLGWWRHVILGPKAAADLAKQKATRGAVRGHWRKGHWRAQAHGPAMSLRKLIYIWRTWVEGTEVATD